MLKFATSFVFLISFASVAQEPQGKTQASSDPKPSAQASDAAVSASALSKDYRKSAIAALSSVEDWKKQAMGFIHCTTYVGGSVYVDRSCAERESDAQTKAEKDVKTAKVDVTTPADKFLQQRLEIYLEAVEELSYHFTHIGSESPKKEIGACGPLIGKALDDGSTVVFEQHPEMKCE